MQRRKSVPRACEGDPKLPRRLGDDPLKRARKEAANAATSSASVAPDSLEQGALSQPASQYSSRGPNNDVFFQRRIEESSPVIASSLQHDPVDAPEHQE